MQSDEDTSSDEELKNDHGQNQSVNISNKLIIQATETPGVALLRKVGLAHQTISSDRFNAINKNPEANSRVEAS